MLYTEWRTYKYPYEFYNCDTFGSREKRFIKTVFLTSTQMLGIQD